MALAKKASRFLAIGAVVLLTPAFLMAHHDKGCDNSNHHDKNCSNNVPDGGSTREFLLAAGATCLGAMFVSSRLRKTRQA